MDLRESVCVMIKYKVWKLRLAQLKDAIHWGENRLLSDSLFCVNIIMYRIVWILLVMIVDIIYKGLWVFRSGYVCQNLMQMLQMMCPSSDACGLEVLHPCWKLMSGQGNQNPAWQNVRPEACTLHNTHGHFRSTINRHQVHEFRIRRLAVPPHKRYIAWIPQTSN